MVDPWKENEKTQRAANITRAGLFIILLSFAGMMTYGAFTPDIRFIVLGALGIGICATADISLFGT